ncbi:hypothetical protein [Anaeromyxobacter diazotrophicus]|uniref:hypothetical protein n=1 Tax=Anaeromyxobacter diazotrophicus TaxID=2590199 RepID=UPI0015908BF0|nr:hypothetical protein [Anaeromyxobacter diazotrophicus]
MRLAFVKAWRSPGLWLWGALLVSVNFLGSGADGYDPRQQPSSLAETFAHARAHAVQAGALGALALFLDVWLLVALTRAALFVLQGRSPSPNAIVATIRPRWRSILVFSALFAAGTFLLGAIGVWSWALSFALSGAWSFSLYLGIPVLAREPATGVGAVRRAWALVRRCWARRLTGLFVTGACFVLACGLCGALAFALMARGTGSADPSRWPQSWILLLQLAFAPIGAFFLVVDQVFDAALYANLTEGTSPKLPNRVEAESTWRARV